MMKLSPCVVYVLNAYAFMHVKFLQNATARLPSDKPVTRRDAEGVTSAEMRNDPYLTTHPTGVAASVAAAARLNQKANNSQAPPS